jgi:TetR/AcrR family transcriptional regulator
MNSHASKFRPSNHTLARILEAAGKEFSRNGLLETRTESIAETAGINRELLYYYFKSKEHLYKATLEHLTQQVIEWNDRLSSYEASPGENLIRWALGHFDRLLALREFQALMDQELVRSHRGEANSMSTLIEKIIEPTLDVFRTLVQQGVASGELLETDWMQLHLSVLGANVLYYTNAPIWRTTLSFEPYDPAELAGRRKKLVDYLGRSIFADRAHGAAVAARVLADTPMPDISGKDLMRKIKNEKEKRKNASPHRHK